MGEIKLAGAAFNRDFCIKKIDSADKKLVGQLSNLGITAGEKIRLLSSNYGKKSYLVKVMGINYSLDKKICEIIWVDE